MKFWVSLLLPRAIYNPAHCVPDLALSKTFIGELKRRETLHRGHRFHEGGSNGSGSNDGANPAMPPHAAPVVMPSEIAGGGTGQGRSNGSGSNDGAKPRDGQSTCTEGQPRDAAPRSPGRHAVRNVVGSRAHGGTSSCAFVPLPCKDWLLANYSVCSPCRNIQVELCRKISKDSLDAEQEMPLIK